MRLKKSDIECVILAGSSHFAISARNHESTIGAEKVIPQRAIFSKILASWHLKTNFLCGLRAPPATHGQVLSSSPNLC